MRDQTAMGPSIVVDDTYAAVVASVAQARGRVKGWLMALAADTLMTGDIELAVSEACTNVVVHGHRNGEEGSFRVLGESVDGMVRVTVSDDGGGMVPRPDSPGLGLGLALMAALTDSLEVRPAAEGSGTVVAMVFTPEGARTRTNGGGSDLG